MPLIKQQLIDLLAKTDAKIDESVDLPPELKTKSRVNFVCKCGQKHSNEIRGITKCGAYCAACMAIRKSKKLSEANSAPAETPGQFERFCKGCKHFRDLSHFENKNKSKYTEQCKKCRQKANQSRKRGIENIKHVDVKDKHQICNQCKIEKPDSDFINIATGHSTKRCTDCRKINMEQEKSRMLELKNIKPSIDEKKCERCLMNRKPNEFKKSLLICETCINLKEKHTSAVQKQRRIEKIENFANTYSEKLCDVCNNYLPLSKFTGKTSICDDCGYTCELCFNNKKKTEFLQSTTKCIECITKQTKNRINERYHDEKLYCENNTVYNYSTLENIITDSGATNMKVLDIPLNKDSTISFVCKCGNNAKFNYVYIKNNNIASCTDCSKGN